VADSVSAIHIFRMKRVRGQPHTLWTSLTQWAKYASSMKQEYPKITHLKILKRAEYIHVA
jgi:hypothetical protein